MGDSPSRTVRRNPALRSLDEPADAAFMFNLMTKASIAAAAILLCGLFVYFAP
jgi:hypothetical protein